MQEYVVTTWLSCTSFHLHKPPFAHLSEEAFPASLGNKQPLPQQSHELLLGQLPALHLVGAFPVHATEKVCLSGFCWQEARNN